tara:strand:- start:94 stop:813 length:720 start_codon:yes stop_codon:yes gene_type:complete
MKISIYWISRKRTQELCYSISSFVQSARNPQNLEIIVCHDDDDTETPDGLSKINRIVKKVTGNDIVVLSSVRHGYWYLDRYANYIGTKFTGDCLLGPNDDMFCDTIYWDDILIDSLKDYTEEPVFIWPECSTNTEPPWMPRMYGINKKWYQKTKNVYSWYCGDVYFPKLIEKTKVRVAHPKFEVHHLRQLDDSNYSEGRGSGAKNTRERFDDDVPGDFERDARNLVETTDKYWENKDVI